MIIKKNIKVADLLPLRRACAHVSLSTFALLFAQNRFWFRSSCISFTFFASSSIAACVCLGWDHVAGAQTNSICVWLKFYFISILHICIDWIRESRNTPNCYSNRRMEISLQAIWTDTVRNLYYVKNVLSHQCVNGVAAKVFLVCALVSCTHWGKAWCLDCCRHKVFLSPLCAWHGHDLIEGWERTRQSRYFCSLSFSITFIHFTGHENM